MAERVLVVEDEWQMRMLLGDNLRFEGYEVTCVGSAEEALAEIPRAVPDVVLVDLRLPGMDGLDLCRELRRIDMAMPIVVITARSAEEQRVAGLDCGADDYIVKPFSLPELFARIRARLRQRRRLQSSPEIFVLRDLVIHLKRGTVERAGVQLELSYREFELLRYFIAHRGEVVSRDRLLQDVWGYDSSSTSRTVDTFVARLRHKLDSESDAISCITSVHGVGYRFQA
jgi:two-component system alkaline phosphatase synthesis response regulator PhoP